MTKKEKIVIGMSGGIDSSTASILLKKQGWDVIGVSLELPIQNAKKDIEKAKKLCKKLNVPHYTIRAKKDFKKEVIDYFISALKKNQTPNPCIICNRKLKFKKLFDFADKKKIKYVATGHYAKTRFNAKTKKYELLKAKDKEKDQTYFLCLLPQQWLKRLIFPLGNYIKKDICRTVKKGKESQDLCFISEKSMPKFLEKKLGKKPGLIMDKQGNILGKHNGLHFFTIGQRKGIGLANGPYYVIKTNKNTLYVSKNEQDLLKKELTVLCYSGKKITKAINVLVKTRYRQQALPARLIPEKGKLKVIFKKPMLSPTPGQFAVFYQGNVCLGGGKIRKS